MLEYDLIPRTLDLREFTGKTVPPKGLLIRFQRTVRPTLPASSVAPFMATVRGEKKTFSGCVLRRRMSDCCMASAAAAAELLATSVSSIGFPRIIPRGRSGVNPRKEKVPSAGKSGSGAILRSQGETQDN